MYILGLNHGEINSSACLWHNGQIISAVPEERFNRQKKTKVFPLKSVEYCLKHANISLDEVDYVAQAWNPSAGMDKFKSLISMHRVRREDYFYTVPDNLLNLTNRKKNLWVKQSFENSNVPPTYFIQHHLTHASNAFYLSEFKEAAILTADWKGEYETVNFAYGQDKHIDVLKTQEIPHSLGMFYAAFTALLGYRVDSDEWKVMALSAFDIDYQDFYEKVKSTVVLNDDGTFELDQTYFQGGIADKPKIYTDKFLALFGNREGVKSEEPDEWHLKIAKAMQRVSEEIVYHMLTHLQKVTKSKNLVLGGGFFMNSVCNGKIIENTPFENIYISYSPSDVGNSIGAALYCAHTIQKQERILQHNVSYMGPEFTNEEIVKCFTRRKVNYVKLENRSATIAKLLSENNIVAHFNGRMEFGERALGNRSILGNPLDPNVKDHINSMIKFREGYRPFAPSCIFEKAHKYFDVEENYECFYMEKVIPVRKEYHEKLPSITHVDGSGRLQTVSEKHNQCYYDILKEFEKITGYPIVVNTSFNINGEPVVLSPDDALNTFYNSGMTHIVLGDYLVTKK